MGSVSFTELLAQAETDEVVAKTKVLTVLEALPRLGKVKARRLLEEVGIADNRRVQGLGEQQRQTLIRRLADN